MRYYYFHISSGLRGLSMPDMHYITKVKTRKELKETLTYEYEQQTNFDDEFELSKSAAKRHIASIANSAWKNRTKFTYDFVIPTEKGWGIFVSSASASDYVESLGYQGIESN